MESVAEETKENDVNSYDETPYSSFPYAKSSPGNLKTLGRLFGMNPPAVETARVLELGCAEGGNIVPHAIKYPRAEFIGVDLSKVQIDAGKVHIEKMGLKNIELKHMSLVDIDQTFGKFDYIICHGVFSWVPDFVKDKIFEVCSKNLSPEGVAYISYNTLPGWNMIRTIRDMMLYHTEQFTDPEEKVSQSRILLNFINDALTGSESPHAVTLKKEAELLSKCGDHYLMHEHLEENNKQYYFSEFMAEAEKHDLQYLSDCALSTMYLDNMPKRAAEKLAGIGSLVRAEQYMDFINNRRFRRTLLCHKGVKLNRGIDKSIVREFAMSMRLFVEKPLAEVSIETSELMHFYLDKKKEDSVSTTSPAMKAILYTLAENQNNPLEFDDIVRQANEKVKAVEPAEIAAKLEEQAVPLLFKGILEFSSEAGNYNKVNLDKPKLSKIAYYQITNTSNEWVTNGVHDTVPVGYFDKLAGQHMNGKNTVPQMLEKMMETVKKQKLTIEVDKKPITDQEALEQYLQEKLDRIIRKFFIKALFI